MDPNSDWKMCGLVQGPEVDYRTRDFKEKQASSLRIGLEKRKWRKSWDILKMSFLALPPCF